jgi:uncharacterized membrane protein YadS
MKRLTKFLIIACCVSICGGGAVLSIKERAKENRFKTKIHPINNREKQARVWIWS